jgi:hypothetical protein
MKRKLIILFIAMNILIIVGLAGMFVLAEAYPLRPGGALYRVQHTAEQWRMQLSGGGAGRAAMALELAERRLGDLAQAGDQGDTNAAAVAFDRALDEAVRRVAVSPWPERDGLEEGLAALLGRAELVLAGVEPGGAEVTLSTLTRSVSALQAREEPGAVAASLPAPVELQVAEPIPFLGQEIDHTVWPLTGGHEGLACEDCHEAGEYAGTPGMCEDCHGLPESEVYEEHFEGACEDCHLVDTWEPTGFDHAGIVDCQSCHEEESPAEHYTQGNDNWWLLSVLSGLGKTARDSALLDGGEYDRCADCHTSTEDWYEVAFEHFGFTDCMACHRLEGELAGHYPGQCSLCHTTEDWEPLAYEHAEKEECRSCHAGDSPAEHYLQAGSLLWYASWEPSRPGEEGSSLFAVQQIPERCGNCHADVEDWGVVAFDHEGFEECEMCHAREGELAGHYEGACSNCHVVDSWEEVRFDHAGYTDCASCHELEEAHYPDQCSLCHSVEEWQAVAFSHEGFASCASCHGWEEPGAHYPGRCVACHTTEEWGEIVYEHKRTDDCQSCHELEFAHYRGQCSTCHNTETWANAIQPHSGLIGCGSCHYTAEHYAGSCAKCHTTSSWREVVFDHTDYNDCRACHDAPAGHYPAQCSACHNTEVWENYTVNHVALASCTSCHAAPVSHWVGECTQCHESQSWMNIVYEHYMGSDCASCHPAPADHWSGQCSLCHNLTNWWEVTVDHSILTDCLSCHPTPDGHWPGQCSSCHGTSSWDEYTFNHDGYDNCKACHGQERPASHERGQCSQCHTTDSWSIPTPTPEPTEEPTPIPTPTPTEEPTPEPVPTEETGTEPGTDTIAP